MEHIQSQFKSETNTIQYLLKAFFFVLHLAIMTEILVEFKVLQILKLAFFIYLSKPYFKMIRLRYYTYWTFSLGLVLYLVFKIYQYAFVLDYPHVAILYFLAFNLLTVKMYLLSSPIYYPRFNWWEYDFRFRDDLKISLKHNDQEFESRLTDLRRHAGCISLFKDLELGSDVMIEAHVNEESVLLRARVMTKKKVLLGRPLVYGVHFKFDSRSNKKRYEMLKKLWIKDKNIKKKEKIAYAN